MISGMADSPFPRLDLPVTPPLPPMEAKAVTTIPSGSEML